MIIRLAVIGVAVAVSLAACSKGEPKGQVVARVDKDEITVIDLQQELGGFKAPDAKVKKLAEQQALNAIIGRKIVAQAAEKQKIDKTPEFAREEEKTRELLLTQSLQDKLAKAVPAPSGDEVRSYIAAHPDLYSARKLLAVEGMRFAAPADRSIFAALQPLNTLEDVSALLKARNVNFQPASGEIDALAVDPRFAEQLLKLKPGEVFVVPQNNLVMVAKITGMKTAPVSDAVAVRHATAVLRSQRTQESMQRQMGSIIAAGRSKVKYNKDYEPPKPPTPAKGGAAAPAGKSPTTAPAAATPVAAPAPVPKG